MSGLDDLNTAVANLQASLVTLQTTVATAITDFQNALNGGDSDAAVEAAAQTLNTVNTGLQTAVASMTSTFPVAVTPPPVSNVKKA